MESLPLEITLKINESLSTTDLCTAVRVCKAWNSIFLMYIYQEIDLVSSKRISKLRNTLNSNNELGLYVRCLNGQRLYMSDITPSHIIQILQICTHLESLHFEHNQQWLDCMLDLCIPTLVPSCRISIDIDVTSNSAVLVKFTNKYRLALAKMSLQFMDVHTEYLPLDYAPYFQPLPNLTQLNIRMEFANTDTLNMIFRTYPSLNTLVYTLYGSSFILKDHLNTSHTSLTALSLTVNTLHPDDLHHLFTQCPNIVNLAFIVADQIYNPVESVAVLMKRTQLTKLSLKVVNRDISNHTDMIPAFWKHALKQRHAKGVKKSMELSKSCSSSLLSFEFTKCPYAGLQTIRCAVEVSLITIQGEKNLGKEYLEDFGHCLTHLKMYAYVGITSRLVNTLCPALAEITLKYDDITKYLDRTSPHPNVTKLVLKLLPATESTMRLIEASYPKLKYLSLEWPSRSDGSVKCWDLPDTGLEYLHIKPIMRNETLHSLLVIKEVDNVPVCRWLLESKKTVVNRDKKFCLPEDKYRYHLRSPTLKSCIFELNSYW
ncbi:hypothetical protein BDB01DRAFT_835041 [Pilobolus umbonatus]|nr:hypothetical protein BDB01DRAFT_835041 [Pilobolus umbonatus]